MRAGNEHGWSGWVNSAAAGPYTPPNSPPADPPAAVASVTLTRADGTATASWDAPSGATKYHVTYNDGSGWQAPVDDHRNVQTTSITFSVDNAKTVVVGVRAGNEHGWSGWVNSAASGPYTPPPPPTPPGIIVQDAGGAALSAISVPEGGQASYQVVLAAAPTEAVEVCIGLAVRDNDDPDISFKGEAVDVVSLKLTFTPTNWDTAQTVTLVAAFDADSLNGARDITHDAREYYSGKVDITATEIDTITSPAAPSGLTATAGDGSVTLTWGDPSDASITHYEYNVNHNATGTGNLSGWSAWTPMPGQRCVHHFSHLQRPDQRTRVPLPPARGQRRRRRRGRAQRRALVRLRRRRSPRARRAAEPHRRARRGLPRHRLGRRQRRDRLRRAGQDIGQCHLARRGQQHVGHVPPLHDQRDHRLRGRASAERGRDQRVDGEIAHARGRLHERRHGRRPRRAAHLSSPARPFRPSWPRPRDSP